MHLWLYILALGRMLRDEVLTPSANLKTDPLTERMNYRI